MRGFRSLLFVSVLDSGSHSRRMWRMYLHFSALSRSYSPLLLLAYGWGSQSVSITAQSVSPKAHAHWTCRSCQMFWTSEKDTSAMSPHCTNNRWSTTEYFNCRYSALVVRSLACGNSCSSNYVSGISAGIGSGASSYQSSSLSTVLCWCWLLGGSSCCGGWSLPLALSVCCPLVVQLCYCPLSFTSQAFVSQWVNTPKHIWLTNCNSRSVAPQKTPSASITDWLFPMADIWLWFNWNGFVEMSKILQYLLHRTWSRRVGYAEQHLHQMLRMHVLCWNSSSYTKQYKEDSSAIVP